MAHFLLRAACRSSASITAGQLQGSRSQLRRIGIPRNQVPTPAPTPQRPQRRGGRLIGLIAVAVVSGAVVFAWPLVFPKEEPARPQVAEIKFEKPRRASQSKEDNRGLISSQHLQVQKSWESPGVYVWGSNSGKVTAPDSKDGVVKTPRRIAFFDGKLLRDLKVDRDSAAAVLENGDLVQWGSAFSEETADPVVTLKGKDLIRVEMSRDRIIGLSSSGAVYSMSVARVDQQAADGQGSATSWIPLWSSPSAKVGYRTIKPKDMSWGERVVDVKSGREHCLLLTSAGRVFSVASSTEDFPSKGQLGIPGLTWATRPAGEYDQPHEIASLRGFEAAAIATGDFHSLILDKEGRLFAFGDNSSGQLGFQPTSDIQFVDSPSLLALNKLYNGTGLSPKVTSIAAGGAVSFFTVDATRVGPPSSSDVVPARGLGDVVADTWACGEGINGTLGTGRWTHVSSEPTKIKALSGLFEYDETANKVIPIRLSRITVGNNHASAVMDNVTYVAASRTSSENDTNWGADIVFWGGNEHYQLGTGKRNNANAPLYIQPLDGGEGDALAGRKGEMHRFQITPRHKVRLSTGRQVSFEQRVVCGKYVTAVYSGI
jgi:alpha-tubulin suppressor-like RCC1 family protein